MVANHKDSHGIDGDAEEDVVREPSEVGSTDIPYPARKRGRCGCRLVRVLQELCVEGFDQSRCTDSLVVRHDFNQIRVNPRMEDQAH